MRLVFAALLVLIGLGLAVDAYLVIKPALHVVLVSVAALLFFRFCLKPEYRPALVWRTLTIAAGMPILAWSIGNIWLLFAALAIGVPLVARRFALIAPVYLFALLLLPGLDTEVMIGSLKLFDCGVFDALAIGAAGAIALNKGKARPPVVHDVAALAVILMIGFGLAREASFAHLLRSFVNVLLDLGLPYYIVTRGVRSLDEIRTAMLWIGCGAVTLGTLLAYELTKSWPIYNSLYAHYHLPTVLIVKERAGYLRTGGPFTEPTSVAMVLAICILCLWLGRAFARSSWHHHLLLAVAMVGLFAPQSRGAWIGLIIGMIVSELFRRRYFSILRKGFAVTSLLSVLLLAATISADVSESIGLSGDSSESSDYRRRLLDRGVEVIMARPITGHSLTELQVTLNDMRQGEGIIDYVNAYIWIALIMGVGGLLLFVAPFLYYLKEIWRLRWRARKDVPTREAATFLLAGLVMMMEMLFFNSFGTRPAVFVFILFGLATAFLRGMRREARATMPRGALAMATA